MVDDVLEGFEEARFSGGKCYAGGQMDLLVT
jgi:hypothetical protein